MAVSSVGTLSYVRVAQALAAVRRCAKKLKREIGSMSDRGSTKRTAVDRMRTGDR